jgi:murein DD-endopeptidase MepM/ murein hydrolase activator NlpD
LPDGTLTTSLAPEEIAGTAPVAPEELDRRWQAIVGTAGAARTGAEHVEEDRTEVLTPPPCEFRPGSTRRRRRSAERGGHRSTAVRAMVAGVLGALTIGAPFLAAAEPGHGAQASASTSVSTRASVLVTLDAAAAGATVVPPTGLLADPTAAGRALINQASRAGTRGALPTGGTDGANGALAAVAPRERIVMPVAQGAYRITSLYGWRNNPVGPGRDYHAGVDFAAPLKTPIYAVADGRVTYVGPGKAGRSGMLIILEHEIDDRTVYTWYNHEDPDGMYVAVGQQVSAGEVIAGVGNYGRSTGPHLHFEVHTDDALTTTEPLTWLEDQGAVDISQVR